MSTRGVLGTLAACVAAVLVGAMVVLIRPDLHAIEGRAKIVKATNYPNTFALGEHDKELVDSIWYSNVASRYTINLERILGDDLGIEEWHHPLPVAKDRNFLAVAQLGDKCTAYVEYGSHNDRLTVGLLSYKMLVIGQDFTYENARSFFILRPFQTC